jgi:MFS family permease
MTNHHDRPGPEREGILEALADRPAPPAPGHPPALFANRPFLWLALSYGAGHTGFYAFFVGVMGHATYGFGADAFQLAVLFSSFSVVFLLSTVPFGMVADRWSPKWMLAIGMAVSISTTIPALLATSIGWLYLASVFDGLAAAIQIPARGALTGLLVEEGALVRANGALNTASMVGAILGPAAGGLVLRYAGQDAVYWLVLGFVAVGGLAILPIPDRRPRVREEVTLFSDLLQGFRVTWRVRELRDLLFLTASIWLFLTVWAALLPLFVREVLHRGADTLGLLWSANGVGSLAGAVAVTRWKQATGREVALVGTSLVVAGLGFLAMSATSRYPLAVAGNVVLGVGFAWFVSLSQALIQRVAGEDVRGRVTAVHGMAGETIGLACTAAIAALAALVVVQPLFVASAVVLAASGLYGLRHAARVRT